jgi:hypothetical protein
MKATLTVLSLLMLLAVPLGRVSDAADLAAIKTPVARYKASMEAFAAAKARDLFTIDPLMLESGGAEDIYAHCREHHLGPDLAEFREIIFHDYPLDLRRDTPFTLTTTSYVYRIVLKEDGRVVERQGVTTSVLKEINGQ